MFTKWADTVSQERLHNNPVENVKLDLTGGASERGRKDIHPICRWVQALPFRNPSIFTDGGPRLILFKIVTKINRSNTDLTVFQDTKIKISFTSIIEIYSWNYSNINIWTVEVSVVKYLILCEWVKNG